jgi:uncharacterized membrane protein
MIEFMDEDELLAEFHRADILLPRERAARERRRAMRGQQGHLSAALADAAALQQLAAARQSGSRMGGLSGLSGLGGLFGNW